jgi:integrase/recombinase XerD
MARHNAENERIKRDYLTYLKAAKGLSEASLDTVVKAIHRFETSTRFRDFRRFHIEQAIAFRRHLAEATSSATGRPLSQATVLQTLNALRAFFLWLAGQPGYRSRISYSDDYFRLSEKETRIAKSTRERPVPTVEQILGVLQAMPRATDIERRNRAVIAFTLLTGVRDGALASFKLKHVDVVAGKVVQDAREVKTKFAKSFTSWFFPAGEEVRAIVEDWVNYLRQDRAWATMIRSSPRPKSSTGKTGNSSPRASLADIGPTRPPSARSSATRSAALGSPTSTRTRSGKRLPSSASASAARPRRSRRGHRISATKTS